MLTEIWQNPAAFFARQSQMDLTTRADDRQVEAFPVDTSECAFCGRGAMMVVAGEPRCSWHVTGRLGGVGLNMARARKRVANE